jgi:hypothetical protein
MGRDEILTEIYNEKFYKRYITLVAPELVEEAYSEFLLMVCELCESKLKMLYESKGCKAYFGTMIHSLVFNKYSTFNKMHGERNSNIEDFYDLSYEDLEPIDQDLVVELVEDVYKFLESRTNTVSNAWYDEGLFKMYFGKDETYRSLSDKTKIPYSSIFHNIKGTQQVIKSKFKDRYDNL